MKLISAYCFVLLFLIYASCKREDLPKLPEKDIWTTFNQNGLGDNSVNAIFEDSKGLMWFGTEGSGLYQFDGTVWKRFRTIDSGILSDWIYSLAEDKSGNLYIGTFSGISIYKGAAWYYLSTNAPVISIEPVQSGDIYFGTAGQGYLYLSQNDQKYYPRVFIDTTLNYVEKIFEDSRQNLWFCTKNGLLRRGNSDSKVYRTSDGLAALDVRTAFEDNRGQVWFGFWGGGDVQHFSNGVFQSVSLDMGLPNNYVFAINQDMFGKYWFGTIGSGVIHYNGALMEPISIAEGIVDKSILSICRDHHNNLWFGGLYGGVSRLQQSVH